MTKIPIILLQLSMLLVRVRTLPEPKPQYVDYEEYADYEFYEKSSIIPEFKVTPMTITTKVGEDVRIPCESNAAEADLVPIIMRGKESPQVIFVGHMQISSDRRFSLENGYMKISNVKRHDAGIYECRIEAPTPIKITHTLNVYVPPSVKVTENIVKAIGGSTATLSCRVQGDPIPEIKWSISKKSGQEEPSSSHLITENGMSLTIANLDRHDSGTYTCTAENDAGRASASQNLTVLHPPEMIIKKTFGREDGASFIDFECIVHAEPVAAVHWSDATLSITKESSIKKQNDAIRSVLRFNHVEEKDFGNYACRASNNFGQTYQVTALTEWDKAQGQALDVWYDIKSALFPFLDLF